MDYIAAYQKSLKKTISRNEIEGLVGELIILNTGVAIRQVKDRWKHGEGVNGGIIGRYSWESYRMFKQSMNPLAGGTVDLFLTGALSEGLTIRKTGAKYQIFSTDIKYTEIGLKYGFEEYGLTEQQALEFFDQLYEFAVETILNELWA